jgi:hypothetical protein
MNSEALLAIKRDLAARYRSAGETVAKGRSAVKRADSRIADLSTALAIVQGSAEEVQNFVHSRIADLVEKCLGSVFQDPYKFQIKFVKKRGKTEAHPVFVRNGNELSYKDVGGGVIDVTSFALRLACLSLMNPRPRKLLVLDEPFRFLSKRKDYRERIKILLETLSKEMGFQIIQVTHDSELEVGKVVVID